MNTVDDRVRIAERSLGEDRLRRIFPQLGKGAGGRRKSHAPSESTRRNFAEVEVRPAWQPRGPQSPSLLDENI